MWMLRGFMVLLGIGSRSIQISDSKQYSVLNKEKLSYMKIKSVFIQKIILSTITIFTIIIAVHLFLDAKNRNNCMSEIKNCANGVKKYSYTSKYIGECDCIVTCK